MKLSIALLASVVISSLAAARSAQALVAAPGLENDPRESARLRQVNEAANSDYDKVVPYYFEVCATSGFRPLDGGDGGDYGHGIILIRGACRDNSNPNGPVQIRFCPENPSSTIGISTDAQYHNVNWTVTDTRGGILYGDHPADQPFTRETRLELIEKSLRTNVYRNVVAKPWNQKEAGEMGLTLNQWLAQFGFGTDYALTMARGVSCARVPLVGSKKGQEAAPLKAVIDYLNELNRKAWAATSGPENRGYEYEYLVNNCTHPAANSMAQLGLIHERNTSLPGPVSKKDQIARENDFAVPYNVMYETFKAGNQPLDVAVILNNFRRNPRALAAFLDWGWLGPQAGVIIEDLPSHTYQNSYFHTEVKREFFSLLNESANALNEWTQKRFNKKLLKTNDRLLMEFEQVLTEPAATDLRENLLVWKSAYETALRDPALLNSKGLVQTALKDHFQKKLVETKIRLKALGAADQR